MTIIENIEAETKRWVDETDGTSGGFWYYMDINDFQDNAMDILKKYKKINVELLSMNKRKIQLWISVQL